MALRGNGLGPIPWTLYFLVSIFNQVFFIVGSFQWTRMNATRKALFVVLACIELFFSIGRGTAFGVVSLATTFFLSSMLWAGSTGRREAQGPGQRAAALVLSWEVSCSSGQNLYSRSGNVERSADQYHSGSPLWSAIIRLCQSFPSRSSRPT